MPTFNFKAKEEIYDAQNALTLGEFAQLAYTPTFSDISAALVKLGFSADRFIQLAGRTVIPPIDTQGFVVGNQDTIVVAFRGTQTNEPLDWITDAKFLPVGGPGGFGLVHQGFHLALNVVFPQLLAAIERLRDNGQSIWFTGHSLGGALALLAAWRVKVESGDKHWAQGVYTFGQPCIGDRVFATKYDGLLQSRTFRFVNHNDLVPRLLELNFKHVGQIRYFDETGRLNSEPSVLERIFGRALTTIQDLRTRKIDGFDDHHMDHYIKNLKSNLGL